MGDFAAILIQLKDSQPIPPKEVSDWLEEENFPWGLVYQESPPSSEPVGLWIGNPLGPFHVATWGICCRFGLTNEQREVLNVSTWYFLPNLPPLEWLKSRIISLL